MDHIQRRLYGDAPPAHIKTENALSFHYSTNNGAGEPHSTPLYTFNNKTNIVANRT